MDNNAGTDPKPQGGAEPTGGAEPKPEPKAGADPKPAGKTYSQADVDKLLNDQKKQYEGKMTEAEKLANMTAEERAKYEKQQREDKLAEREKTVAKRELQQTARDTLRDKGLDASLADILDYTDADSVDKSIKTVEKVIKAAIEKGVDDKLKASGGTPRVGSGGKPTSGVEAAFYKLNPNLKK
ncbi:MAG: DUF4355 domain-containing protein [Candidatus Ornithomonoglobus sp.]